jgi:pro-sigmaK processing inhibitor BofA
MKIFRMIYKKIIISVLLLYCFNYISISFQFVLPMNLYSFLTVYFFGEFGLIGLVIFKYIVL